MTAGSGTCSLPGNTGGQFQSSGLGYVQLAMMEGQWAYVSDKRLIQVFYGCGGWKQVRLVFGCYKDPGQYLGQGCEFACGV